METLLGCTSKLDSSTTYKKSISMAPYLRYVQIPCYRTVLTKFTAYKSQAGN